MPPVRFCNHTTWGHDPIELSYPCETRAATLFIVTQRTSLAGESTVRAGDAPSRFATPPALSPPAPDAAVTGFPIPPT
jgi:hypothetical protein